MHYKIDKWLSEKKQLTLIQYDYSLSNKIILVDARCFCQSTNKCIQKINLEITLLAISIIIKIHFVSNSNNFFLIV